MVAHWRATIYNKTCFIQGKKKGYDEKWKKRMVHNFIVRKQLAWSKPIAIKSLANDAFILLISRCHKCTKLITTKLKEFVTRCSRC